ncbi:MAG: hypothetical protein Q3984_03475 [Eubacteriales bacterium]|nr:hypothetical protein [Eubacteriales bacterium]
MSGIVLRRLIGILTILSIFGIMPVVQGLWFLIAAKQADYLDKWRWFLFVPSALFLLWFFLFYTRS